MNRRGLAGWVLLAPALLWVMAFFVVPFAVMALYSVWRREGTQLVREPSLVNYETFLDKSYLLDALFNSLEITAITVVLSVLFAYPLAYILAFLVPRRWQRLGLILAILPFWTSYLVRSYSWLLVLSENGVISQTLVTLGLLSETMSFANSNGATVLGFVHFFTMLLALTIYANLVQISPNYRRAAEDLGASRLQSFIHVVLPLSLPGIMIGAFITFVLAIGDYVTPQILGGNRELVMPQAILLQVQRRADFPMASAMSLVLMLVISAVFLASARWLKMDRV
ncbi:MAG: ABC transporter permease [bacterium]|nr:ABC transporter permease [bacterium]